MHIGASASTASAATSATSTPTIIVATPTPIFRGIVTASASTSTVASLSTGTLVMLIEVARAKIVAKVHALVVQQLLGLLVRFLLTPIILWLAVLRLITLEAKKSVCIDVALHGVPSMRDVQVRLELLLSLESNVALLAAGVIRADEVRAREVHLQLLVVVVEHVAEVLAAQVAR